MSNTTDPDVLPGQAPADNLAKIREAARTKKAVLEVQRLEQKLQEDNAPDETAPAKPKLPAPSSRNLAIEQLLEYWQSIPPQFHARLLGYLYRYWPIIQRTPAYIDKFSGPPESKTWFLREWGTGEYELKLTDLDKPKGAEICRARFKFSESHTECPPILDPLELDMGRKENKAYIEWSRSKGLLKMAGDTLASDSTNAVLAKALVDLANRPANANKTVEGSAWESAIGIMSDASKRAIEVVKGQAGGTDLDGIAKLITAVKPEAAKPSGTDLDGIAKLIAAVKPAEDTNLKLMLAQLQQQNTVLLTKLLEQKPRPAEEDSLTKQLMAAILPKLLERALDGGKSEGWVGLFENPGIQELLGQVGTAAVHLSSGFASSRGVRPNPAPGVGPQPITTVEAEAEIDEKAMFQKLFQFFAIRFGEILHFVETGKSGQAFAAHCAEAGMSPADHQELQQIGRDRIMSFVREAPAAWPRVQPIEAKFVAFVDQFLAWSPEEDKAAIEEIGRPPGRTQ